jgi:tetratricopeptide (TPR) repeat protein
LHYHALSRRRSTLLRNLLRHLWQQARRPARPDGARQPEPPPTATLRQRFDALMQADDVDGALALAADTSASAPDSYEAHLLMGRALQKLHQPQRALECYEAARRLRDDDAELYDSRASTYQEAGRLQEAFADYDRALALRPDFPLAAFHRSLARLLAGDFRRGWDDYELRRMGAAQAPAAGAVPRWDGSPLAGRTLLIVREQGLGDEIMYASMLPQLIAQGRCIVECDPRLLELFRRSFPAATFFGTAPDGRLPPAVARESIDATIEAGSLAGFLRRDLADFPRHAGYLRADPAKLARWQDRLAGLGPGRWIGLSWTGGVRKTRRALRSLALEQLLPLLRQPGLRFVSLQYTPEARAALDELRVRHGIDIAHWQEAIDDYDETAALVCALERTVSVCTSLVHLCGALGRPVWVMAPLAPEWRYGMTGETMPWYSSVRIFRQTTYGDWAPVIERVARELGS